MLADHTTLTQFLIEERRRTPGATGDFSSLVLSVTFACKAIGRRVARGALAGIAGSAAIRDPDTQDCDAPQFGTRGLFRPLS
jgi:fructose-1,6-bisphosphatase I/sedoheptulose-1,7-bisphosphatase